MNGLMIAALARCGLIFDRPEWIALAERALAGVRRLMTGSDGRPRPLVSWTATAPRGHSTTTPISRAA
jgi:uncharacterized protein YyaL (SSP411 family)